MVESTTAHKQGPSAHDARGPLAQRLLAPETFPALTADACALVEKEIKKRGMTMRTAYGVALKVKPDLVTRTVTELMPGFVAELEPCYAVFQNSGSIDLRAHFIANAETVADAMLSVADRRAQRIHSRAISSGYKRVRGRARREIIDTMPQIADVLARHAN
ncbi:DUF6918 family protein [Salinisphaera aquimarina]|uniref:DUF6918 family protein n=1 Tax=Salinisphaera aquimarina TaxID=2094031 RepID=A0ABV7EMJ4_9GAMM